MSLSLTPRKEISSSSSLLHIRARRGGRADKEKFGNVQEIPQQKQFLLPPTAEPDYKLKCIGYWKENLKSYLITYDELDPYSKYRCWVYQRADLNKVLMSQSVGPFCNYAQTVLSPDNGAAIILNMVEYEREREYREI